MSSERAYVTVEQLNQMMARISELEADNARHLHLIPPPRYEENGSENASFTNEFASETPSGSFASVRSVQSATTQPPYPESWNSFNGVNGQVLTVLKTTQDELETTKRQLQIRNVEFQQATVDKDNLTHEVAKLRLELSRKEQELVANDETLTEICDENEELTAMVESFPACNRRLKKGYYGRDEYDFANFKDVAIVDHPDTDTFSIIYERYD